MGSDDAPASGTLHCDAAAIQGERITPGRVDVEPYDSHMTVHRHVVRVTRGPKDNGRRPAVDPLFRTAARIDRARVVGAVLTGNPSRGTEA